MLIYILLSLAIAAKLQSLGEPSLGTPLVETLHLVDIGRLTGAISPQQSGDFPPGKNRIHGEVMGMMGNHNESYQ